MKNFIDNSLHFLNSDIVTIICLLLLIITISLLFYFKNYVPKEEKPKYKNLVVISVNLITIIILILFLQILFPIETALRTIIKYLFFSISGIALLWASAPFLVDFLNKNAINKRKKINLEIYSQNKEQKENIYWFYFNPIAVRTFLEGIEKTNAVNVFTKGASFTNKGSTILKNSLNNLADAFLESKTKFLFSYFFQIKCFYKIEVNTDVLLTFLIFISNNVEFESKQDLYLFENTINELLLILPRP